MENLGRHAPRERGLVSSLFAWPILRDARLRRARQDEVFTSGATLNPHGEEARRAVQTVLRIAGRTMRPRCCYMRFAV